MQLRYPSGHTGEHYVRVKGWRDARLARCPNHPQGGCSLARHGTYERKTPRGTRVARFYCPESHTTFSLLPDCLAARLPGTLADLEAAVAVAEQAPSLVAAANIVRRDAVHLPGAVRWLSRRVRRVHRALMAVRGLLPEHLARCAATVVSFRDRLATQAVLVTLRELAAPQLSMLPAPLGFYPPGRHLKNSMRPINTTWGLIRLPSLPNVRIPGHQRPRSMRNAHERSRC